MDQKLFNSQTGQLEQLELLEEGKVSLYYCGATVQGSPHLGHLRSALVYDQLRRWLEAQGQEVYMVRNITDIDDKILFKAHEESVSVQKNVSWEQVAEKYIAEFDSVYEALNILPPHNEPRASEHIQSMLALIEKLIEKGYAYQSTTGSADVFFDVEAYPGYGSLTHQKLNNMEGDQDAVDLEGKKHAADFALWKARKDFEPDSASWQSPWGLGRPGWHIECSAMSMDYLGAEFDIHGGGVDLRFPHHENELAQAQAASNGFARLWMHNGMVTTSGEKMSKSIGNIIDPADLLQLYPPLVVRYFLGSVHYRSPLDFTHFGMLNALSGLHKIIDYLERVAPFAFDVEDEKKLIEYPHWSTLAGSKDKVASSDFKNALKDDLNIPEALAAVFDSVRIGHKLHDDFVKSSYSPSRPNEALRRELYKNLLSVGSMLDILGINPLDPEVSHNRISQAEESMGSEVRHFYRKVDRLQDMYKKLLGKSEEHKEDNSEIAQIEALVADRNKARLAKDFEQADKLRKDLSEMGVELQDSQTGTHWNYKIG